jgi:hypothetical protein
MFGGVSAVVTLLVTVINPYLSQHQAQVTAQIARDGQFNDQFKSAIEQLKDKDTQVRLFGIDALGRIAESPKYHMQVISNLASYVRRNSPWPPKEGKRDNHLPDDIQKALTVLGRRTRANESDPIDLSNTNLTGAALVSADLSGADLTGAHLNGANLAQADLKVAHLSGADLTHADLEGADLEGADLSKSHLDSAKLSDARLKAAYLAHASLRGAELSGADLTDAIGLGTAHLEAAQVDESTKLPGTMRPKSGN